MTLFVSMVLLILMDFLIVMLSITRWKVWVFSLAWVVSISRVLVISSPLSITYKMNRFWVCSTYTSTRICTSTYFTPILWLLILIWACYCPSYIAKIISHLIIHWWSLWSLSCHYIQFNTSAVFFTSVLAPPPSHSGLHCEILSSNVIISTYLLQSLSTWNRIK